MCVLVSTSNSIRDPNIRQKIYKTLDLNLPYISPSGKTVSVMETLEIIRDKISECDFSDSVLIDIIAGHAIQRNYNMYFDTIKGSVPYTIILEEGL